MMTKAGNQETRDTRILLDAIAVGIRRREFRRRRRADTIQGWGGADVVFATEMPDYSGRTFDGFYPEPTTVVTPYAHEAGWLINRLKQTFRSFIHGGNKCDFYGALAEAAIRYQKGLRSGEESAEGLLSAVLEEARNILTKIEKQMAPGSVDPSGEE